MSLPEAAQIEALRAKVESISLQSVCALHFHSALLLLFSLICHREATSRVQTPCTCQICLIGCLLSLHIASPVVSPAWLLNYLLTMRNADAVAMR